MKIVNLMKISKAFTLMELLIVISIIAIMTSMSIMAMVGIENQRNVDVVAEQVKNRIYEAHSYAMAPSQSGVTKVKLAITDKILTIDECLNDNCLASAEYHRIATDDWSGYQNISFTTPPPATSPIIKFTTTNPNTIGQLDPNSQLTITINDSSGKKAVLTVDIITGKVTIT